MERQEPTKLNDSVHEFSCGGGDYEVEVVAFHGLCFSSYENAYITTWQDKDKLCWLRDIIAKKCPKARVLSVSYDSCAKVSDEAGRMTFSNLGRILVQDVIHLAEVGQRGCPVVLIGYCLGGLVIEQLCIEADNQHYQATDGASKGRLDKFLTNVRSILYLDTPHTGSALGDYLREKKQCKGPVLEYLSESSSSLSSLNSEFDSLVADRQWELSIRWYSHVTKVWDSVIIPTPGLAVVTESSARRDSGEITFRFIEADHSGNAVSTAWNHLVEVWDSLQQRMETITNRTKLPPDVTPDKSSETVKQESPEGPEEEPKEGPEEESKIRRKSNLLYVMHQPRNKGSNVELELIFFPGTADEGAYKSTWSKDDKDCWLQTWLPKAFPRARILAVSLLATDGKDPELYLTCENLSQEIIGFHKNVGWCPLILVGHCKGGLVIKNLCSQVEEKLAVKTADADQLQAFLRNIRGIAYYGTSHNGHSSEDSSRDISSRYVRRLNSAFKRFVTNYGWKELALGETRPTQLGSSKSLIVDEASASHGIQRNSFFPVAADHDSICKPESPLSNSFLYLKNFIHTTMNEDQYRNMNVRRKKLRGMAIIISMEKGRVGSDIDRRLFIQMAGYIRFRPLALVNEPVEDLRATIQEGLKFVDNEDECLVCCVSAHGFISGGRQFIHNDDKAPLDLVSGVDLLSVVLEPITDCPKLVGKPKVFIINACRDYKRDPELDQIKPDQIMPKFDDCLLMYSCRAGESAWRRITGNENGTLFVGEVTNQVQSMYHTTDVRDIFEAVKKRVPKLATELGRKQEPVIESSLTKRLSWRPR